MNLPLTKKNRASLERQIRQQERLIEHCGGCEASYVLRYGSAKDAHHLGHGGAAIYAADRVRLETLRALLLLAPAK